jgi:hypothetical protein
MLTIPGAISHNSLFKDGFPYTHTWMTSDKHDPQLFIAKAKLNSVKADLKRALGNDGAGKDLGKKQKIGDLKEA